MATYGWGTDGSVADWLFSEGYRFDFHQAVRLLEMLDRQATPVGQDVETSREPVRFKSRIGLDFAASDIDEISRRPDGQAEMSVNFMGLAGAGGPLPIPYTELILERLKHSDTVASDFLDIFNHRLISLMYRARKEHRVSVDPKPPEQGNCAQYLFSLIGLATDHLQDRMRISDRSLLFYSGLLAQKTRSMAGLEKLLSSFLKVQVQGHPLCGKWVSLAEDQTTRLGISGALGQQALLGTRIWDQQGRFELSLGPLDIDQFLDFLPSGRGFTSLCELTGFYVGHEFDFDVQLRLCPESVPASQLAQEDGARLGWTSWIGGRKPEHGEGQVRLSPATLLPDPGYAHVPLFRVLSFDELARMFRRMVQHRLPANTVVVRQGQLGESLFILRRGSVKVMRRQQEGEETSLAVVEEGQFFGEAALLTGEPRTATVVTLEDSVIGEISKPCVEELMKEHPEIREMLQMGYETRSQSLR